MKNSSKKTFIFLAGFLFVSSITSDPLIHDHFEDNDSFVECQLCENKTFDVNGKGDLKVSLFGRNLLDEVARNHASFVKNEVPLPGRNYGIKFRLSY